MTARGIAAAVLLMATVALVGCSDGATVDTSPVATTTVDLPRSYRFAPAAIEVEVGATVTWTNNDAFTHNVTLDGQEPLPMKPGERATYLFADAGTFRYVCSLHPRDMVGTVVVGGG
jgi:plastocyanin